ncbi:CoA transferase [Arthrobacter sp. BF1]|uniref:CoA transferase n=1 Tax=Arthrobacter sp. BF1 TaxID=2821145 RepID=UPI001C4F22A1|nr:CoA transferase [Arthrobacter sp. BF1]
MKITGSGALASAFDVTGFAVTAMAEAGQAVADLTQRFGAAPPDVCVDRGLASLWFGMSFTPVGWTLPPVWDAIAGDYRCADGWIRLHTNAPHHKAAALKVLGLGAGADRATVAAAVELWHGEALENAVVAANGCAALMRSPAAWLAHPQGQAVAVEPLISWGDPRTVADLRDAGGASARSRPADPQRPLTGVRVLDLTRIIAGPVATRFLASYGAQVLRIDPPDWDEPVLEAELTVGKRCARLDLKSPDGLGALHELLAGADIFVHGYRGDALEKLGISEAELARRYPHLIDVALNAYGWGGPWKHRRGFDSLVQMSCGIADAGMAYFGSAAPHPLPVQALDHATGYLCVAATINAWRDRLDGTVRSARLSLARTAVELMRTAPSEPDAPAPELDPTGLIPENTQWGPGLRLPPAVQISGVEPVFDVPALGLGWADPRWV